MLTTSMMLRSSKHFSNRSLGQKIHITSRSERPAFTIETFPFSDH
jgi:hypothetical protein